MMTTEISAKIQLRPTRIAFLTRPTSIPSVRQIMRASACVWGGVYNPIIPVFRTFPKEWRPEVFDRTKPRAVTAGYVKFFEPDVYVEAEEGLLEEAGLGSLRNIRHYNNPIITLEEFLKPQDGRDWAEPAYGLSMQEVLKHIYATEQQFVRRDAPESVLITPLVENPLVEAVFGAYPDTSETSYFRENYEGVFKVGTQAATPELWKKVFIEGATTPLRVTRKAVTVERHWHDDLVLFVFDPAKASDLIDLWNIRLEPNPIAPIPVGWFSALSDAIFDLLKDQHRPVAGNPNGVMHNATIEFARSIEKERAEEFIHSVKPGLPEGALAVKLWRNRIWIENRENRGPRQSRMKISSTEKQMNLAVKNENGFATSFDTLSPDFANRYGRGHARWVNSFGFSNYSKASIASVLPFNTFDPSWPQLGMGGENIHVGNEGWIYPQQFKDWAQPVKLLTTEDAISGSLKRFGIDSSLSEPGHIAKQMLENLGGLWGVHFLADLETIQLLNKMAGGVRRKKNNDETIEEHFGLRTAPLKDWTDLIARRKERQSLPIVALEDLTQRNIIRLGLETDCPHCRAKNWTTLTSTDYSMTCERCLKTYAFPQAQLRDHNRNWTYRVIGPFSVPDYGRGSYSALLTLAVLSSFNLPRENMTFATALDLNFDNKNCEVDFAVWRSEDRSDGNGQPRLVIGEAKSLGTGELLTSRDIGKMKLVASKLPDAIVVFSVLRDHFTAAEKQLLRKFVTWGRRLNAFGEPTNPVLLLTSHELLMGRHISSIWKNLGGDHARFSGYNHSSTLRALADATQQIYLNMNSFSAWRDAQWKNRRTIKAKKK